MAKNRSAEKEEFWRLALTEQQSSGMTIKAFCRQQELAAHAFSWWKREIQKRDQRRSGRHRQIDQAKDRRLIPVTIQVSTSAARAYRSVELKRPPANVHQRSSVASPSNPPRVGCRKRPSLNEVGEQR